MDTSFAVKVIRWTKDYSGDDPFTTPILLQDANGPCPLIALVNSLLIKNDILHHKWHHDWASVPADVKARMARIDEFNQQLMKHATSSQKISLNELLTHLGDLVLFFSQNTMVDIDQVLNQLPRLHTGLDVNPNLINGTFAGNDLASTLFGIFDLKFRHGWCVNQVDPETDEWPHDYNYETTVDTLYRLQTFDRAQDFLLSSDDDAAKQLVNKWLDVNRTQLTNNGLSRLNIDAADDEVLVFFRNNHFNTLYKRGNHEFYLLVTDMSVQKSNKIIWQSLNSISGSDDLFFTGEFYPVLEMDDTNDADTDLAKQLQQEEDAALARKMQDQYDKKPRGMRSRMQIRRKEKGAQDPAPSSMLIDDEDPPEESMIPKPKSMSTPPTKRVVKAASPAAAPAASSSKKKKVCVIM
ncbi:hypothetical protein DIURU_004796 [Diutina rugosa]|uniref:MINDY deubiquitinase domain-containing protein n=1 Tax=Diutina rugosa TaxID=5481 RepID=A0A642UF44_DIURU|nr:uncharacterized protein DIURU_004796 [Diutina rugosa]KAA8897943.1 hypothetical protein DIURU_004796 [Diutina rugosa]